MAAIHQHTYSQATIFSSKAILRFQQARQKSIFTTTPPPPPPRPSPISGEMEGRTEEEKKARRGSKFAPLPAAPPPHHQTRLAHPGGPMKTNKAAALAKFLERKLQEPNGLASVDPKLVELAVQNAKDSVNSSGTTTSGWIIHHVGSFGDSEESAEEEHKISASKKRKKKKMSEKKKNKKQKKLKGSNIGEAKQAKKKMKPKPPLNLRGSVRK